MVIYSRRNKNDDAEANSKDTENNERISDTDDDVWTNRTEFWTEWMGEIYINIYISAL